MRTALASAAIGLACTCFAWGQAGLEAGNLTVTVDRDSGFVRAGSALDSELVRGLNFRLSDGGSDGELPLTMTEARFEDDALFVRYACDRPLDILVIYSGLREGLLATVLVTNDGDRQELLEVALDADIGRTEGLSVFDGRSVSGEPQEAFGEDTFRGRLQLCAAWNEQAGVGLGLAAPELRSWFHHSYVPPDGEEPARLSTATRLVLDPGRDDTVTFFAASRPGEWGFYEVLDAYYETYPAMFRADPDVDERANLGGGQYRAFPRTGVWSPEICRRLFVGWEWCYAPFRRTGDIYGREQLWDYEPVRPFGSPRGLPRDEYFAWRREAFEVGRACNVAMMFYVPSQVWCEERLAREVYPDALIEDPTARTLFTTPWVTGHDNERLVFPYQTSFAEQSYRDMADVAEELNLQGFALDTAGGGGKYRGPALDRLDGRAWDEDGVYCRNSIAVAHLMQYVHTLTAPDGTRLAVVSNPSPRCAYSAMLWSDSAMLEGEPWKVDRTYGDSLRWMAGHKTLVWWEGYGADSFVDVEMARPDQLRMLLRGLADFTLLQSLRIGYIPPPNFTQGFERLVQWLPAITECVTTGWQPVPAARVPEPLWATRYGDGLDALIAIAHETAGTVQAEAVIENRRFAEGALVFTDYDGGERTNRIAGGETKIALTVPTRTPVLLRAQAAVAPADAVTEVRAAAEMGLTGGTLWLGIDGRGQVTVRLREPEGMRATAAWLNGAVAQVRDGELSLQLDGRGDLKVRYASRVFRGEDSRLLDFPFTRDGQPACTIHLPYGVSPRTRLLAERLQLYFRYWHARVLGGDEVAIPIEQGEPQAGPAVLITPEAAEPAVFVDDADVLHIAARNERELEDVFYRYLRALDTKYWTAEWGYWLRKATQGANVLKWDETP